MFMEIHVPLNLRFGHCSFNDVRATFPRSVPAKKMRTTFTVLLFAVLLGFPRCRGGMARKVRTSLLSNVKPSKFNRQTGFFKLPVLSLQTYKRQILEIKAFLRRKPNSRSQFKAKLFLLVIYK